MDNEKIIVNINEELKEIYPLIKIKYDKFEYLFYITIPNDFNNIFVGKIIDDNICPVEEKEYQNLINLFQNIILKIKNT